MSGDPGLNGGTSFNFCNFSGALFHIGLDLNGLLLKYFGIFGARIWNLSGGRGPVGCNTGSGSGRSFHLTNLANFMGPKARLKVTLSSKNENFGRAPALSLKIPLLLIR